MCTRVILKQMCATKWATLMDAHNGLLGNGCAQGMEQIPGHVTPQYFTNKLKWFLLTFLQLGSAEAVSQLLPCLVVSALCLTCPLRWSCRLSCEYILQWAQCGPDVIQDFNVILDLFGCSHTKKFEIKLVCVFFCGISDMRVETIFDDCVERRRFRMYHSIIF